MTGEAQERGPQPPACEWREHRGRDWLLIDSPGSRMAGLSIGYGQLDEPVEDMGVLHYLAAALKEELARPVETGPGHVGFPEVQVAVAPATLDITISGDLDVVAGGMRRLEGVFCRPEIPETASAARAGEHDQMEDLVLRFGANSLTMHHPGVIQDEVRTKAQSLLARLDPAKGTYPHVMVTNDVLLIGCAFDSPLQAGAVGAPGAGRRTSAIEVIQEIADDPRQRRGTVVSARRTYDLATAITVGSLAGMSAFCLLVGQVGERLQSLAPAVVEEGDPRCAGSVMGRFLLLTLRSSRPLGPEWTAEVHRLVAQLPRVVSDERVRLAVDQARSMLDARSLVVGRLQGIRAQEDVTVDEVRYAYNALLETVHLIGSPDTPVVEGYPEIVGALEEPRRPGLLSPGWRSAAPPGDLSFPWTGAPRHVVIRDGRLTAWMDAGSTGLHHPQVVDLDHLAYALRDSYGGFVLTDQAGRRVAVSPRLLSRGTSLRRRLETAVSGVPVMTRSLGPGDRQRMEAVGNQLAKERRARAIRRTAALVPLLLIGGYGLYYWANLVDTVETTVALGQSVTLSNGTVVTARAAESDDADRLPGLQTYILQVCGGGDTEASNATAYSQRQVDMDSIHLQWNGTTVPSPVVRDPASEIQQISTVRQGECVSGPISFLGVEEPDDPVLVFSNPAGDTITWRVP